MSAFRRFVAGAAALAFVAVAVGVSDCAKKKPSLAAISHISAFTSGEISRESAIRVVFVNDMADSAVIGKTMSRSPLSFNPAIKGVAVWVDSRTIEFRPDGRLPGGRKYSGMISLPAIVKSAKPGTVFKWAFRTIEQSFDVSIAGLQSISSSDARWQQLSGTISTADVEYNADVEKMVAARQEKRALSLAWTHSDDRRVHTFVADSIRRSDDSSTITVRWDGGPIGIEKKDEEHIGVPSLSSFTVAQVRAVQQQESYVEVRFSDPLQAQQNLRGLITIGTLRDLKFTVDGNIVKVYAGLPFTGTLSVQIQKSVRNCNNRPLKAAFSQSVVFEEVKPKVKFAGTGVIIPTTQGVSVPIEAVNLTAVKVSAVEIFERNVPQFLQINELDGTDQLHRVGRVVWEKRIPLDLPAAKRNTWVRYGLDLSPLVARYPTGIFRLTLSFGPQDIEYTCTGTVQVNEQPAPADDEGDEEQEQSFWDGADENYNPENQSESYGDRENPCKPAYYRSVEVSRNILVSDIGLMAKKGTDSVLTVIATDLKSAQPLSGAAVRVLDYQQQEIAEATTNGKGFATINVSREPFLVIASQGKQAGYLKLEGGRSLAVSHFDVSGDAVRNGIKGMLYGERGVWRPGDSLFLTFALFDPDKRIPENHPVVFELRNPRGQVVRTLTATQSAFGFYGFRTATQPADPTGNWTAVVRVGGFSLEKTIKIETVMPNRLKIKLDFGKDRLTAADNDVSGTLSVMWLHGAVARGLDYKIDMSLASAPTRFAGYEDYTFDDPVRAFAEERSEAASGSVDNEGQADVSLSVDAQNRAPGLLTAGFYIRVFEDAGAFSTDRFTIPYYPYKRFMGIAVPKGDKARGMLLTDTDHVVRIVSVDANGKPAPLSKVLVKLYKIHWRWWWDRGSENLADYETGTSYNALLTDTVRLVKGAGTWKLRLNYPEWGRYLIRVIDLEGGHCTGMIKYIDWPGWAGRQQKDKQGAGVTMLTFSSDKDEYKVGEKIVLTIPTAKNTRGLVSLESGTRIVSADWFEGNQDQTVYEFTAQPAMAPSVYAFVSLLQPHLQTQNDLPIRTYGVIPIAIVDPETKLTPLIEAAEVLAPESEARITVREKNGREMAYTLAVVDEGLLDLTRFSTPDPWLEFYKREALGVSTWDLYSYIAGAYGGSLEKLLAVGGDGEVEGKAKSKANRFPPMVRFIGPCVLKRGQTAAHTVSIPQYVGSVRIMAVAGKQSAFGSADRQAFVRRPLMLLGTLPRVLGPGEETNLPVAVFALDKSIKEVEVSASTEGPLEMVGDGSRRITFTGTGDQLVSFKVKGSASTGVARAFLKARAGGEKAQQTIELDIRSPMVREVTVVDEILETGKTVTKKLPLPGIAGTNKVTLEISRIPPINLGERLAFLIQYPHGCIEQTTSSVFPQVYLDKTVELSPEQKKQIEHNIKAGIDRLLTFQTSDGGFAYWPGEGGSCEWGSNYAGHFLVEAGKAGYSVSPSMMDQWKKYQRNRALNCGAGGDETDLTQAYRLYLLALAQSPELSAMNRLKESSLSHPAALWQLAAAYVLAGQPEAGKELVKAAPLSGGRYTTPGATFGSDLRDKAMILEALLLLDSPGKTRELAESIAAALGKEEWMSTQTTAYALVALARFNGATVTDLEMSYSVKWMGGTEQRATALRPICQTVFAPGNALTPEIAVTNTSSFKLWARFIMEGLPAVGTETEASEGLRADIRYLSVRGDGEIDPGSLEQGTDFMVQVTVHNTGKHQYDQVALNHIFPSGWEIHNERMDPTIGTRESPFDYRDVRDDRVYTYFSIEPNREKTFRVLLNASYAGMFYLPPVLVEAMYDATVNARVKGRWVKVVQTGE